jgi:AcrR family transcriptional regulator
VAGKDTAADPERVTELLWAAQESRGRPGLNLDGIVAAAVAVADEEGIAALSMRRVAERLGFTTMSLYRHVPGKAELVELMRDAVHGEPQDPLPEGDGWREGLAAWARARWALHLRHPWLVHTAGCRRLPGPNTMADHDRVLRIAERTGLAAREVVGVISFVEGFVDTAARQVAEFLGQERESGVPHEEWWRGRSELYERMSPYPTLDRLWWAGGFEDPVDPFDFGLDRTLDGVELLVRRRRDETRDVNREAAAERCCATCGRPIGGTVRGRPRDYCSPACRQRAYRERRAVDSGRPD